MFIRALAAFLVLPGMVGFVVPLTIAWFDPWRGSGTSAGIVLLIIGAGLLFWCIRDFYVAGKGTLAPWDPPQQLVIVGLYKYSRNPMYLAVLTIMAGWAVYFGSWLLAAYAALFAIIFHVRVIVNEEPWLAGSFGGDWDRYRESVPRWLLRF